MRVRTLDDLEATQAYGDNITNNIQVVDAYAWEGNRGERCDFWKENADAIPA